MIRCIECFCRLFVFLLKVSMCFLREMSQERLYVNLMRTMCWLVRKEHYSMNWTNERGFKKYSLIMKVWDATFSKSCHDWFNKWTLLDINQSETMLEGQFGAQEVTILTFFTCPIFIFGYQWTWLLKLTSLFTKGASKYCFVRHF